MKWIKLLLVVSALSVSLPTWAVVDINQATESELASALKGVGKKKAKAIVDYRKNHGHFKSLDDLVVVKGISSKTIEKNRKNMRLSNP